MIEIHLETIASQEGEPLSINTLCLGDPDVRPCLGCRSCFDQGEETCPLQDDVQGIKARPDLADGIIFASPGYVNAASGAGENWIERLAYLCHRPGFAGNCAILVATVGSRPTEHTLRTVSLALRT